MNLFKGLAALAFSGFASIAVSQTLFISSEQDNAVYVLTAEGEVVDKIATGERPRDMRLSADGQSIYLVASNDARMEVIDVATRKVVRQFSVGDDPEMLAIHPTLGRVYVANEDDAELSVWNLETGEAIGEVEVGEEPEGVLISSDGKTVYVTSEVANLIHVVDAESLELTKNIQVDKRPRRMVVTQNNQLWVTNEVSGTVSVIDRDSHEVVKTLTFEPPGFRAEDITPVGITLSHDGKTAFVMLGRANHVAFVDTATGETSTYLLVGNRAWNAALNRAGDRLYVVNGLSDDLSIIDVPNRRVLKSVPVGRTPHTVVVVE